MLRPCRASGSTASSSVSSRSPRRARTRTCVARKGRGGERRTASRRTGTRASSDDPEASPTTSTRTASRCSVAGLSSPTRRRDTSNPTLRTSLRKRSTISSPREFPCSRSTRESESHPRASAVRKQLSFVARPFPTRAFDEERVKARTARAMLMQ